MVLIQTFFGKFEIGRTFSKLIYIYVQKHKNPQKIPLPPLPIFFKKEKYKDVFYIIAFLRWRFYKGIFINTFFINTFFINTFFINAFFIMAFLRWRFIIGIFKMAFFEAHP